MLNSGEEAPLDQLVDCIVTAQGAGFSEVRENSHAINEVFPSPLFSPVVVVSEGKWSRFVSSLSTNQIHLHQIILLIFQQHY
jgi:hypothetical protein